MTHYKMQTIGPVGTLCQGHNTIRRVGERYHAIRPGDTVSMEFISGSGSEEGDTFAMEWLTVKAVSMASLEDIVTGHFNANHGLQESPEDLMEALLSLYPETEEGDQFVAIYF